VLRIRVSPGQVGAGSLAGAIDVLAADGVVAFPTETFYGLAVDPRSCDAVHKVFALKHRRADQPLPLIAADLRQIADHVGIMTPLAERLAARWWPGPLTLVLAASSALCVDVHLSTGKVAVRVPGDLVARTLAELAGHAITSTSANLSGEAPAATPDEVAARIGDRIDVLIDAGPTPGGLPSTIVDATGAAPVLIRAGAIAWERVLEF
jgi:L-threonylcarbamoyladenylate synthase